MKQGIGDERDLGLKWGFGAKIGIWGWNRDLGLKWGFRAETGIWG